MATIESNEAQIAAINTWINSVITNSRLPAQLAAQTSITDTDEVSILQKGTDDAKGVGTGLLRGFKGVWSATANTPTLIDGTGISLDTYYVDTAGSQNFGNGLITFAIGDMITYSNGLWIRVGGLNLALTNIVHVNSASDFPAAVGGVRELSIGSGIGVTYLIAAKNIDMGSDRFTVTNSSVVIQGTHRTASTITSTTSGNLFTVVDSSFFPEFIVVDCVNAKVVDYSTTVPSFNSFTCQNLIVLNCDTIFDIDGAFTTSLRTMTVVEAQTGGILWTGTGNGQINISNFLGISWAGTLLDLGTATFDIITVATANRFISPSGTIILSGLAANGNLTATGRGIVEGNLFNGLGTAVDGIDTQDTKWSFNDNIFVDNNTANSLTATDSFLTASTTATIGSIGVYVAIGGVNWGNTLTSRFTVGTDGLVTYIGLRSIIIAAFATATVEKVGGGSDLICTKIAINGTVFDKTIGCTDSSSPSQITSIGYFAIETGDTIQLFVGNEGSTSNIIVSNSTLAINTVL